MWDKPKNSFQLYTACLFSEKVGMIMQIVHKLCIHTITNVMLTFQFTLQSFQKTFISSKKYNYLKKPNYEPTGNTWLCMNVASLCMNLTPYGLFDAPNRDRGSCDKLLSVSWEKVGKEIRKPKITTLCMIIPHLCQRLK